MDRNDAYAIALGILQVMMFFSVLSIISVGPGIAMMGRSGFSGYGVMAGFFIAFALLFRNLSFIVQSMSAQSEHRSSDASSSIQSAARGSVSLLLAVLLLHVVQALFYLSIF